MTPTRAPGSHAAPDESLVLEAARYALLRRLAPALRHEAVGHLQPITMVTSVLERRMAQPHPDTGALHDGVRRLCAASRTAVQACVDIVDWLAPDPGEPVTLREAVQDSLDLLRGPLGFGGFRLLSTLEDADGRVGRSVLRQVLPACLLWLTDQAGPPAQVRIAAEPGAVHGPIGLRLSLEPAEGEPGADRGSAYRPLAWREVAAIARDEGIVLSPAGDTLALQVPRLS